MSYMYQVIPTHPPTYLLLVSLSVTIHNFCLYWLWRTFCHDNNYFMSMSFWWETLNIIQFHIHYNWMELKPYNKVVGGWVAVTWYTDKSHCILLFSYIYIFGIKNYCNLYSSVELYPVVLFYSYIVLFLSSGLS